VQNPKAIIIINNMAMVSLHAWRVIDALVVCGVWLFSLSGCSDMGQPLSVGAALARRTADDIGGDREMITSAAPLQLHVKPESRSGMLVFNLMECRQKISTL
jgi:hypothetical protein